MVKFKKLSLILLSIVGIYLIIIVYILVIGLSVKGSVGSLTSSLKNAGNGLQTKNLDQTETSLKTAQADLQKLQSRFKFISFLAPPLQSFCCI